MYKTLRLLAALSAPILAAGSLASSANAPVSAEEADATPTPSPTLSCTPADEWNALFDRAGKSGWLGADGIYSVALDGNDNIGSAGPSTNTLFFFSDTLLGTAGSSGRVTKTEQMPNHSAALLTGNTPDPDAIRFVYGYKGDPDNRRINLFGDGQWLFDCFCLDGSVYLFGFNQTDWKPSQIDMIALPITDGQPDFAKFSRTKNIKPLLTITAERHYDFGMGILNNTEDAGVPDPDGYLYFYGYIDNLNEFSRKDLIVSRISAADFPDFSKLTYFDGQGWGSDPTASAVLIPDVSCETSVSPITGGPYKGKYIAIFTKGVQTAHMMYAIGDSPVGPFSEPVEFYTAPESDSPAKGGEGNLYTYNAKAHPHLSSDGRLLVSYNVNDRYGLAKNTYDYHPRFLWLDLQYSPDEIAAEHSSSSAPGGSTGALTATQWSGEPVTTRPQSTAPSTLPPSPGSPSPRGSIRPGLIVAVTAAGAAVGGLIGAAIAIRRKKR